MFLNWVFRYTSGGWIANDDECEAAVPTIGQDQWQGFLNHDSTDALNTDTLAGNVRFVWMQKQLQTVFQAKQWH